ncbi:alpha-L-fucosidase [Mariniflexile fucanivorans]|uniref:alpha-L-fucosidase n=1 Tax=Mariniflexile fucanivorans TaxID=264023 RepID=A0A4R1RNN4_9FLAO|nr:alpha-L-fucosidase [Mariniflexile fucanivorans]TCL67462.1 alpha-L-fucosidase [Mariniflexile fucanivorans]
MKKKIIITCLFVTLFLIVFGCINKLKGSESKEVVFDQTKNWILLNKEDATKTGTIYSWEFEKGNPIEYMVQVVFEKDFPINAKSATITMDDQEAVDALNQSYKTYNGQLIAEFKKTIKFSKMGKHVFTIDTDTDFKQIRIIPHYKNPLGSGQYHEQWLKMHESPEKQAALKWFKEAKFGMFIHWGLYSQAGGMWKGTRINDAPFEGPKVAEWLMHAFQIPRAEYAELAKTFNPDKSFAENIAKLAKKAGMKYVVITSKHHDGFSLFDSKVSNYDMVDATPYKADAVKELYDACLSEGLDFGVYYSHGNDWNDGGDGNYANVKKVNDSLGVFTHDSGKNLWDPSPNSHADYFKTKAMPQVKELINLLPKLRLIWFDGEGLINEDQSFQFYKLVYDTNPNVLVNRRVGWDFGDYLDAGDNKIPSADETIDKYWETCGTTNNSWGYKVYDTDWKSTQELLYYFVDILSKGGNYLLNIGPDGKGNVPEASANGLIEMGDWIATNKEAVYGTSRWKIANEGQVETLLDGTGHRASKGFKRSFTTSDFWFTAKENKVYAISLVPASNKILIRSLNKTNGEVKNVRVLGSDKEVEWKQTELGLEVNLNGIKSNKNGFVIETSL